MQTDKTTLRDLSFMTTGHESVLNLIDHTTTHAGKEVLRRHILSPPDSFEELRGLQDVIRFMSRHPESWTLLISNGTLVMLEKFFEAADGTSAQPGDISLRFGAAFQKLLNRSQYSFTQFSISHLSDFFRGCRELTAMLEVEGIPQRLSHILEEVTAELNAHRLTEDIAGVDKNTPYKELVKLSFTARRELKNQVYRLMHHYSRLDAWHSLAVATIQNKWTFPDIGPSFPVMMHAEQLYHPLLSNPVSYDISFDKDRNFLILTGANMSGKTTFMRTLGVSALMAHLGMGVPASAFKISFMQGIITNMHVEDNILAGESFFFAEVQRIKQTAQKLLQPLPHLVLMDELFKGTNVHDAYECTKAVVDGLVQYNRHIMVLSTHLYEVAQQFNNKKELIFAYFVTDMSAEGNYSFSYELKEGISNDRIGYRILQKEGVIDLLRQQKER
jgi:DNA mismatch repair ATPase MutS